MDQRTRAQQDLDAHIAQLELELSELKRKRNTLSPISQLPPELLCRILSCNALTFAEDDFDYLPANPLSPTLHFSHVSHLWRAILLKSARMWSYIQVGKDTQPELLRLLWTNTGLAPVDMNIDTSKEENGSLGTPIAIDAVVDIIRQYPAKFHSLRLRLELDSVRRIFEDWKGSFDHLNDLLISDPKRDWGDENCASIGQYLTCQAPALRRFLATGYTLPFACPLLSAAPLKIVRVYQDGGVMEDFFNFLRKCRGHIRIMEMGIDIAPSSTDITAVQSTRQLPSMETLCFEEFHIQSACWSTLVTVLSTIRLSSSGFSFSCGTIPDENLHNFFTAVAHALGGILAPQEVRFRTNSVIAFWHQAISHPLVDGVRCVLPASVCAELCQPRTHLDTKGRVPFGDPQHYQAGWSFANLRILTIAAKVPRGIWPILAHHSTPLEVLRVGPCVDCYDMFDGIRGSGAPSGSTPFPYLQVIVNTCGVPWNYDDRRRRRAAGFTVPVKAKEYPLDLAEMLKARQKYSEALKPLALLDFRNFVESDPGQDVLCILHTVANDVVWDARSWWAEGVDYECS